MTTVCTATIAVPANRAGEEVYISSRVSYFPSL